MKIEKITENKIKVTIKTKDLAKKYINNSHFDVNSLIKKTFEKQDLFLEILLEAEKKFAFYTEGYRLLIEAFSIIDEYIIFTITKSDKIKSDITYTQKAQKKFTLKKKSIITTQDSAIFKIDNINNFYELCNFINNFSNFKVSEFCKNISLHLLNNTYFLIADNIYNTNPNSNKYFFIFSEFANLSTYSPFLKNKILEHGKTLIKKDAITVGKRYFT